MDNLGLKIRLFLLSAARVGLFVSALPTIALGRLVRKKIRARTIVIKFDALGDFVMSLGFIKDSLKGENDFVICGNRVEELANSAAIADRSFFVDELRMNANFLYRMRVFWSMSKFSADSVVCLQSSRVLHLSDQIALAVHSRSKTALSTDLSTSTRFESYLARGIYHTIVDPKPTAKHETEAYSLLSGFTPPTLQTFDKKSGEDFILVSISASSDEKTFPPEMLGRAVDRINITRQMQIRIVGDSRHANFRSAFRPDDSEVQWMVGETSLQDIVNLVSSAKAVITSDSLVGHLAQHFSKPYLVIRSGVHWDRFFPYPTPPNGSSAAPRSKPCKCELRCTKISTKQKVRPCLENIPDVLLDQAIEELLSYS